MTVHTLKVSQIAARPAVWRRLEVPSSCTLGELDDVLLVAFHPGAPLVHDDNDLPVGDWMSGPGDTVTYIDSGERRYRIRVERVGPAAAGEQYPRCTSGAGLADANLAALNDALAGLQINGTAGLDARQCALVHDHGGDGGHRPAGEVVEDRAFAGLFPSLLDELGTCSCGCEETDAVLLDTLPVYRPEPDDVLAGLAAASPLVQRAVALARWLGRDRAVTSSRVLRPGEGMAAVAELGLDHPLIEAPGDDAVPGPAVPARPPRSAKDLPGLHPLWLAATQARLVDVGSARAVPGPALAVWDGPAMPMARIEQWATLLAGYLRARSRARMPDAPNVFPTPWEQVLPATAPLLYASAREPVPVGALAVTLADLLHGDGGPSSLMLVPMVIAEVFEAVETWVAGGVLEVVEDVGDDWVVPDGPLGELISAFRAEPAGDHAPDELLARLVEPIVDMIEEGPFVRLTPLGRYGLARLLTAHGWDVPTAGDCAELEPAALLDRLFGYALDDALDEAACWVEARGEAWERGLREAAASAAGPGSVGPSRRAVLPLLFRAAGPRAVPLLSGLQRDEWLGAAAVLAKHLLGAGPEPSPQHRLWYSVDQLSLVLGDDDEFEDAVDDTDLLDLLAAPAGVATAVGLQHPRTGEVLRAVVPLVPDRALARRLRQALQGRGSPHPPLRSV